MAKHVVVVGAGVIGLCTAYYCAQRGWRVTLIERHPQRRDGSSFGNAGMIVPSHFVPLAAPGMVALGLKWMWNPASPFYVKPRLSWDLIDWGLKFWRAATPQHVRRAAPLLRDLSLASRECFEQLAASPGIDFGLVKKGMLLLCKTAHALDEEAGTAKLARELGMAAEVIDARQAAALDAGARMDIAGAVYYSGDCHFRPDRFMARVEGELVAANVQFHWDTEVLGWQVERGRQVRAVKLRGGGAIEADEFILCGGSWSPLALRDLGLTLPLQAGKGYSLTLKQPRQLPNTCSILVEARVAVTPMAEALRFAGTMEIAGLNHDIQPLRVRGIIAAATSYYPEFEPSDFAGVEPWSGLRPCSPDGLPYIGRTAKFANFSIATGHAMMGMSLGPITGKLMAQVLAGETPQIDLAQLSPDRYARS